MRTRIHFIDFRHAKTQTDLVRYCGLPDEIFDQVVSEDSRRSFYIEHRIPKRRPRVGNSVRTVWEIPDGPLRDGHKAIARRLELFAREVVSQYPHPAAFGYIPGRGTYQNAKEHCGAKFLLRTDLKDFFPSIKIGRVSRTLCQIGFNPECTNLLARFCTIDDQLPLGLHASPLLANLVCLELDDRLTALAKQFSCTYTRYADDITFSGLDVIPSKQHIRDVVEPRGFKLSDDKFRFTKLGQAHFVTGLSVSDSEVPHVPKKMKRRLRLELYYCRKVGVIAHLGRSGEVALQHGINRLDGLVRYVSGIERKRRQPLRDEWAEILAGAGVTPTYSPREEHSPRRIAIIVDEAIFERRGEKRYLAIACAVTEEVALIRSQVEAALRDYLSDPYAPGRRQKLERHGVHFSDVHDSVKEDFTKRLAFMPFRGYVGYAPLESDDSYQETYISLVRALLPRRFMAADRAQLTLYIEENSKVRSDTIKSTISQLYMDQEKADNRRPYEMPEVALVSKKANPEIAVPDFLLGTLGRYLDLHNGRFTVDRLNFERLRDKFRVVLDLENNHEYSRRRVLLPWP